MQTPPAEVIDYVRSAALLLDLPMDDAQLLRVATHLARTRALATPLRALDLPAELEPAEVFCPAPFPAQDAS